MSRQISISSASVSATSFHAHRVLRNTYCLLSLALLFSAAAASTLMNLPHAELLHN